ncbi:hypothetical protein [Soonwooa sp.]|uniref:hypothetical protein n=1 Tax=Soonwooa sp. TaxID=1938592 RepID=UPI002625A6B3|nr:hypothetical protein [Soonwooa sp.]
MKRFNLVICLLVVVSILGFLMLFRHSIFKTEAQKNAENRAYQQQLDEAAIKLAKFNKDVLTRIELDGTIIGRNYERNKGDKYSLSIKVKHLNYGNLAPNIDFLYDFRNRETIRIYYYPSDSCSIDDSNIGDAIRKNLNEDYFTITSNKPNQKNTSRKLYFAKQMFLK